eukprot:NP_001022460.1 Uncharacterized protein CELE_Y51H7C.15 [Caenorhabditis elegans]
MINIMLVLLFLTNNENRCWAHTAIRSGGSCSMEYLGDDVQFLRSEEEGTNDDGMKTWTKGGDSMELEQSTRRRRLGWVDRIVMDRDGSGWIDDRDDEEGSGRKDQAGRIEMRRRSTIKATTTNRMDGSEWIRIVGSGEGENHGNDDDDEDNKGPEW